MYEKKVSKTHTRESLYMTMLSISDGVISVDRERNIIFINKAAQKYTGWNEQNAIGQRLDAVFNVIDSKTREKVECHFAKLVNSSEKTSFSCCPILISKSGSERYVSVNLSPIKNENQQVLGAVVTFRDVTCHRQIEEELKIERYNLRTQFQYSPAAMVIVDENSIVHSINDRYIDMFGNLNGNVIGEKLGKSLGCVGTINDICGDGEECGKCLIKECVQKVVKSRIPLRDAEKRYQLIQNGKKVIRNLKFNLVPINISGSTNVLISVDDMTEYRVMEENLRRSRDFYLTLFDEFPAMVWRSKTDRSIDYVNKRWLEFTGRQFEQEPGDEWADRVHPDDVGMCVNIYNDFFDRHEPFEAEYRLKRFDEEYRWVVDRAGPYYDFEGNFAGYIGACYDITEQKQARDVLKRYELISEKARDIILVVDTNGAIIEANEAAIRTYGYNRDELLSKTIYDLRRDRDVAKANLDQAFKSGIFFESTHYRKDGSSLPVEVSCQSTVLDDNKAVISIIRDITERKQVELEMQLAMNTTKAAYKAKSEFLANMSHEIRTPLNGIIGMLDLTMLTELSHDQMDNLATAKTCANSLLKIINDVLDFSKMEAGKLTVEFVEFDFKALMEKIVKVHYYRAKEKGIELTYQLPIDVPNFLVGDPGRLQQVLNNLLSNAVKFTDKGYVNLVVKIIGCRKDSVKLQFSVADTGIGISRDEMGKLFKSFSQIDGSQTRRYGGTGLGLVISRQLVEMMGGNLNVESEKGKGSSFSFVIKFEVGGRNKGIVDEVEHLGIGKSETNARILLVEDDKVNQMVISRMLKEMGYKFDIADCGNDALQMLENNSYGLCLMDIQMPMLDGIQTASLIRQNENKTGKQYMPIVAITAHALQGDRERFLSMGMDEYIAKPFQMSELFISIERLLAGQTGRNSYTHEIKSIINEISSSIDKLKLMIKVENIRSIEEIAHAIKASASAINDDKIKTLAFRIELAARRSNQLEAAELCKELDEEFRKYSFTINEMEDLE